MDGPLLDPEELYLNLNELVFINRFTASYYTTFNELCKLLPVGMKRVRILDLGCGAGDWLNYLQQKSRARALNFVMTGVDAESHAIQFAQKKFPNLASRVDWKVCDYREVFNSSEPFDIITCNLFCHHLTDEDIAELLGLMASNARLGFIINDLERHWFAYRAIWILTRLFSRSRYTKNDAPLSVKRGFSISEWKKNTAAVRKRPEIVDLRIVKLPTFRHLVIGKKDPKKCGDTLE